MSEYIGYMRVSRESQRVSGLSFLAQQKALEDHTKATGGALLATFTETVGGAKATAERAQLLLALAECRRTGATLLVAKFDRLSRNVGALMAIMEAGVDIVAADFPGANKMMVTVLAAVAEYEREQIGKRTSLALKAKVQRDGYWRSTEECAAQLGDHADLGRERGAEAVQERIAGHMGVLQALVEDMVKAGHDTPTKLAAALTKSKTLTPADWTRTQGGAKVAAKDRKPWTPTAAMRLMRKIVTG